ncbi:MAG TPA: TonB-dependent receptor [Bacteroidia bacterium]|nr:TonB-dependent receptor [Bacteroidia bacterium]
MSLSILTSAQPTVSDTLSLKTVDIFSIRKENFNPGVSSLIIDSTVVSDPGETAATVLNNYSSVFVKSYGQVGSSTLSIRGTEARHTAILWNGFNINSPTLGLTDLSLIPSAATSSIKLFQGGSSPVFGNSSLGGTVILEPFTPEFSKNFYAKVALATGSFGNLHGTGIFNISGRLVSSRTTFFYTSADNKFSFENSALKDHPEQIQQHAKESFQGFLQDLTIKTGIHSALSASVWYQNAYREIPPTMVVSESQATQRDSSLRLVTSWAVQFKKMKINVKGGYFNENQFYEDPLHALNAIYKSYSWLSDASFEGYINNTIMIHGGISDTYSKAHFAEYTEEQNRNEFALYTGAVFTFIEHTSLAINIRKEFTHSENPPICPSIHLKSLLFKEKVSASASMSRNFNLPSLNDLYWIPGGNPELKPENAMSYESGLTFFENNQNLPDIRITGYYSAVSNWIKWVPGAAGVYEPINIDHVNCTGFELGVSHQKYFGILFMKANLMYSQTHSQWISSDNSAAAPKNKQLIYIPIHSASGNISASIDNWTIQYLHNFTGKVYTTSDNSDALDGYQIGTLRIQHSLSKSNFELRIYCQINNLWDASYQVIAWRPMPGRWVMFGTQLNIHKNNKQQKI